MGKRHALPDRQIFIQSVGHFVSASISAIIDFSFNVDVWRGSTLFDRFDSAGLFVRLKKKTHHRNVFFCFVFLIFCFGNPDEETVKTQWDIRSKVGATKTASIVHADEFRVSLSIFFFLFFLFFSVDRVGRSQRASASSFVQRIAGWHKQQHQGPALNVAARPSSSRELGN